MIPRSARALKTWSRKTACWRRSSVTCADERWWNSEFDVLELKPVRLAITLGDPRGIGPEVAVAATRKLRAQTAASFIFVGPDNSPVRNEADQFVRVGRYTPGDTASAGRAAGLAIAKGVELVLNGDADALVTAPIDKADRKSTRLNSSHS